MKYVQMISAVVAGVLLLGGAASAEMIQVKGSDTIINLVQKEAEVYMQKNPAAKIAVTGGGSGTGIAALLNNKCDIADASRTITAKEVETAVSSNINPTRIVIAIDGVSFVVNAENPVTKLTVDQLGSIYRGEIKNWSKVGGPDMPITLYGRQSNSGTYAFVREEVLKGEYAQSMNSMNGNSQIAESVKADKSGIGYIGVGYAKQAGGVTILEVAKNASMPYASPVDEAAVASGRYPISRPLNQYTNGKPDGAIKDFLAFELSPEGQQIVAQEGFFVITREYQEANAKNGL